MDVPDSITTFLKLFGNTLARFVGHDSALQQFLHLLGKSMKEMGKEVSRANFTTHSTENYLEEAEDRTGLSTPTFMITLVPLLAQAAGIFIAVAFQYAVKGMLLTLKSYMVRTLLLGFFFFVFLPIAKVILIKVGLLAMAPSILSRASRVDDDPYDTSPIESFQGIAEYLIWEIYKLGESFYSDIDDFMLS
eukprot:GFUD01023405.1.p1 GENE.GFUD01023405.1~~GFUD01023405.1.p1  ORF type:complete len:191 (+),score=34.04 GFUD01023405.1:73-645(+)